MSVAKILVMVVALALCLSTPIRGIRIQKVKSIVIRYFRFPFMEYSPRSRDREKGRMADRK